MFRSRALLCSIALTLSLTTLACVEFRPSGIEVPEPATVEVVDARPTPETRTVAQEIGILSFLNAPSTGLAMLDDDVRLDARAANALVEHRNGPDGVYPSADDQPFGAVSDVLGVRFMGEANFRRLVAYVETQGWMPERHEVFGVFDGVPFTVLDAEAVLHAVNTVSERKLAELSGLSNRAVASIVAARPVPSVEVLAGLDRVGAASLVKLKALGFDLDCGLSMVCAEGWVCAGVPDDASHALGKCRDLTPLDGQGDACDSASVCGEGLACVAGACAPAWSIDIYEARPGAEIGPEGVESAVVVYGLSERPVEITLNLLMVHADYSDLRVTLVDPDGHEMVVWDRGEDHAFESEITVATGALGVTANGRWTLRVEDEDGDHVGTLRGWALTLGTAAN